MHVGDGEGDRLPGRGGQPSALDCRQMFLTAFTSAMGNPLCNSTRVASILSWRDSPSAGAASIADAPPDSRTDETPATILGREGQPQRRKPGLHAPAIGKRVRTVRDENLAQRNVRLRRRAGVDAISISQRARHRARGFAGGDDVEQTTGRQRMTIETAREQTTRIDRGQRGIDESLKMDPLTRKRRGIEREVSEAAGARTRRTSRSRGRTSEATGSSPDARLPSRTDVPVDSGFARSRRRHR